MPLLDIETQQYGDKVKLQRQKQAVPIERRPDAKPQVKPEEEGAPTGFAALAPHSQGHVWAANFFLKKANEPRPGYQGVDEMQASKIMLGRIAIDLAEKTGRADVAAWAEEIMQMPETVYDHFGAFAAAKMDDIDIAEGRYVGILKQPMAGSESSGGESVQSQTNTDNRPTQSPDTPRE